MKASQDQPQPRLCSHTSAATLLAHISRDSARTHQPRLRSHTSAATLLAHISRDFKLADDMPTAQLVPGIHNKPCQPYRGTTFLSLDNKEL